MKTGKLNIRFSFYSETDDFFIFFLICGAMLLAEKIEITVNTWDSIQPIYQATYQEDHSVLA